MRSPRRAPVRGFTLIELVLVASLSSFLAMLLAATWSALYRSAAQVSARCELAQEADFAASSLAADLSRTDGSLGPLVGLRYSLGAGAGRLELCFDGGTSPDGLPTWDSVTGPDTVVVYEVQGEVGSEALVRWVGASAPTVAARHVAGIE